MTDDYKLVHTNGRTHIEISGPNADEVLRIYRQIVIEPPEGESIESLGLSARPTNALISGGIRTIQRLLEKNEKELLELGSLGRTSLREIRRALAERGMYLAPTSPSSSADRSA